MSGKDLLLAAGTAVVGGVVAAAAVVVLLADVADDPVDGAQTSAVAPPPPTSDGQPFRVGLLVPGGDAPLAFVSPAVRAGLALAERDIEEAGGVLLDPVEVLERDAGTVEDVEVGLAAATELVDAGAHVVVGPLSTALTLELEPVVTGRGVVMVTPSASGAALADVDDDGLLAQTSGGDGLQGRALAQTVLADAPGRVVLLGLEEADVVDPVVAAAAAALREADVVVEVLRYTSGEGEAAAEVAAEVAAARPDALGLVGFEEAGVLLDALAGRGVGPQDVPLHLVDGNTASYDGATSVDLTGTTGLLPGPAPDEALGARLAGVTGDLEGQDFAAQAYDAVVLAALAAESVGSDDPADWADRLDDVSREGTACTAYLECRDLVRAGEDVDYDGLSGPLDLDGRGVPQAARFQVLRYVGQRLPRPSRATCWSDARRLSVGPPRTRRPAAGPSSGRRAGQPVPRTRNVRAPRRRRRRRPRRRRRARPRGRRARRAPPRPGRGPARR